METTPASHQAALPAQVFTRLAAFATLPGVLLCVLIALAASFLAEHAGGPPLVYALALGLALNFVSSHERVGPGLALCARTALRIGVALLGARITLYQIAGLGAGTALIVALAVAGTIALGLALAKLFGLTRDLGLVSGCSVGICGASAAMAVAAALPPTKENENFTLLAIIGVTILSTIAMVLYPLIVSLAGLDPRQAGFFLGASIHDVAQVVAAGMMIGRDAADTAAIVKLFRIALLAPVVMLVAVAYRGRLQASGPRQKVPVLPGFMIGFLALVVLASVGVVPKSAGEAAGTMSRWLLMVAIAAAGIKTNIGDLRRLGWRPLAMLAVETVFIAGFVLAAILLR